MATRFYNTELWHSISRTYRAKNPTCEICNTALAKLVDHITPIADGGDKISWDNLQSACQSCHNAKTQRETKRRRVKQKYYE